jgi:hypothetical protein
MMKPHGLQGGFMPDPRTHYGARRAAAITGGIFVTSYMRERRRRRQFVAPSPLTGLSARQAMTVAAIARVIGLVVMVVYAAYYVGALWQL